MTGTRRNLRDWHCVGGWGGFGGGGNDSEQAWGSVKRVRATSLPVLCRSRNTLSVRYSSTLYIYIHRSTPFLLAYGTILILGELYRANYSKRWIMSPPQPRGSRMCTKCWGSVAPLHKGCAQTRGGPRDPTPKDRAQLLRLRGLS